MNRIRKARMQAGLSIEQATAILGWAEGSLVALENGTAKYPATDDSLPALADVYGCSVQWLRGDHVDPPANLVRALRNANVSPHDRDIVLEFAASIQGRPPPRKLADVAKVMEDAAGYDQTPDEAVAELTADGVDVDRFIERVQRLSPASRPTSEASARHATITATGPDAPLRFRRLCGDAKRTGSACPRRYAIGSGERTRRVRRST